MWRKPYLVSAVTARGQVVDQRELILRKDVHRQFTRFCRRHPNCVVASWFRDVTGAHWLLRWHQGEEYYP